MSAVARTGTRAGARTARSMPVPPALTDQRPPEPVTDGHGPGAAAPPGTARSAQVKMSRGRNAETTKFGTSTTSLTLRSTATLQIA
jgi:hypothetical protein